MTTENKTPGLRITQGPDLIKLFCSNMRQVNIACIDEDDPRYVLYSVRVPSPRLDDDALIALGNDNEFGAALAAWMAARARRIAKNRRGTP
jgi:hypothetical protein